MLGQVRCPSVCEDTWGQLPLHVSPSESDSLYREAVHERQKAGEDQGSGCVHGSSPPGPCSKRSRRLNSWPQGAGSMSPARWLNSATVPTSTRAAPLAQETPEQGPSTRAPLTAQVISQVALGGGVPGSGRGLHLADFPFRPVLEIEIPNRASHRGPHLLTT